MVQQKIKKIKGIADIVFCVDFSGSMKNCIEGLKENINAFVLSLEKSDPNKVIDWQIGFCGYDRKRFKVLNFVKDPEYFAEKLVSAHTKFHDEFTPGAIDYCISHFNWRLVSNKFLIVFTDEKMTDGWLADGETIRKFPELLEKIEESKTWLFYNGPRCRYYKEFEKLHRGRVTIVSDKFKLIDFSEFFSRLGKTVSNSIIQQNQRIINLPYIYDLSHIEITELN